MEEKLLWLKEIISYIKSLKNDLAISLYLTGASQTPLNYFVHERWLDQAQRLRYPYDYIRVLAYIASRIIGGANEMRILWDLATAYYTSGFYRTPIADVYSPKLIKDPKILANLGFKQCKITKNDVLWRLDEMAIFIKLSQLNSTYRFIEIEIAGDRIQVPSIEDVLAYHLKQLVTQRSKDSYVKAFMIYIAHENRICKEKLENALNRMETYRNMKDSLDELSRSFPGLSYILRVDKTQH